jgi:hypothetical protein
VQQALGNQGMLRRLQAKLTVNQPGDIYEQEADRVAEAVMSQTSYKPISAPPVAAAGTAVPVQRKCTACEQEDEDLQVQRKESGAAQAVNAAPMVERVLSSPGQPLDRTTRSFMESRFGHHFGDVRIHADARAAESARAISALAYTVGPDIVFGSSRYQPQTHAGRRLLAHELSHVVQQRVSAEPRIQRQLGGCEELLREPTVASFGVGSLVHRIIGAHFLRSVPGATTVAIPGASAGPLRSQGICGEDNAVIKPQSIGGLAGAGFPDLARITSGGILQVAEIKPAAVPCLIDGEEQLLRYIDQGNARDATQSAWRASLGVTVVAPVLQSTYQPPTLILSAPGIGSLVVRSAWCTAGLLGYTVRRRSRQPVPIPVPVPETRRVGERNRLRQGVAERYGPAVVAGVAAGAVAAARSAAGRALWRHFWQVVVRRFALRESTALGLAAADGPLPIGDLIALGMTLWTVVDILRLWDEMWREADQIAAQA